MNNLVIYFDDGLSYESICALAYYNLFFLYAEEDLVPTSTLDEIVEEYSFRSRDIELNGMTIELEETGSILDLTPISEIMGDLDEDEEDKEINSIRNINKTKDEKPMQDL